MEALCNSHSGEHGRKVTACTCGDLREAFEAGRAYRHGQLCAELDRYKAEVERLRGNLASLLDCLNSWSRAHNLREHTKYEDLGEMREAVDGLGFKSNHLMVERNELRTQLAKAEAEGLKNEQWKESWQHLRDAVFEYAGVDQETSEFGPVPILEQMRTQLAKARELALVSAEVASEAGAAAAVGGSVHYAVMQGWADRICEALAAWEESL